jgi:hypothetical protein
VTDSRGKSNPSESLRDKLDNFSHQADRQLANHAGAAYQGGASMNYNSNYISSNNNNNSNSGVSRPDRLERPANISSSEKKEILKEKFDELSRR